MTATLIFADVYFLLPQRLFCNMLMQILFAAPISYAAASAGPQQEWLVGAIQRFAVLFYRSQGPG